MRTVFLLLLAMTAAGPALADEPAQQIVVDPGWGIERGAPVVGDPKTAALQLRIMEDDDGRSTEKVAYLGVSATPATEVLRKQLKLPAGIGLIVDFILAKSPAEEAGLKQYDVLQKLDDQWLVDAHQLAVLVRMHKPGDEVRISCIREGQATTVTAKLAEKEMPPLEPISTWGRAAPPFRHHGGEGGPYGPRAAKWSSGHPWFFAMPGVQTVWLDGDRTFLISSQDGHKRLSVTDAKGNKLFEGPVDTEIERASMPKELRERYERFHPPGEARPSTQAGF